jgi:hypothetical protein
LFAVALLCGCAQQEETQPAAPAESLEEPALQGQVPKADQDSGRSTRPYMKNVRLVGQQDIQNRGENGNLGWIGDCAYVAAYFGGHDPLMGMAVIDASNPKNPELVKLMPGTPGTRESQVEAHEGRGIVIVMPFRHPKTPYGDPPGPTQLQIYDASADCKNPVRVGTYEFDYTTHEHRISADGKTVYATINSPGLPEPGGLKKGPAVAAIDITELSKPTLIATWDQSDEPGRPKGAMHDLDVNDEGTRLYGATRDGSIDGVKHQGFSILDTTEVQQRKPNAKMRRISSFNWGPPENFGNSHSIEYLTIKGRQYVIALDETMGANAVAPWGWGRILDVTEEKYPLQISTITIEAAEDRFASQTNPDKAYYGAHYSGVDDRKNASLAFFSWYSSGLRVWDIRDPYLPREIAYYIPGARTNTKLAVSDSYPNNKVDYVYSFIRYRPESGHIWFTSLFNGFMIAELVDNPLRPATKTTTGN